MSNKKEVLISLGIVALATVIVAADYTTSIWECSNCKNKFKASFKEYFFACHTPTRRKLTCPDCGEKTYCKCVRTHNN